MWPYLVCSDAEVQAKCYTSADLRADYLSPDLGAGQVLYGPPPYPICSGGGGALFSRRDRRGGVLVRLHVESR